MTRTNTGSVGAGQNPGGGVTLPPEYLRRLEELEAEVNTLTQRVNGIVIPNTRALGQNIRMSQQSTNTVTLSMSARDRMVYLSLDEFATLVITGTIPTDDYRICHIFAHNPTGITQELTLTSPSPSSGVVIDGVAQVNPTIEILAGESVDINLFRHGAYQAWQGVMSQAVTQPIQPQPFTSVFSVTALGNNGSNINGVFNSGNRVWLDSTSQFLSGNPDNLSAWLLFSLTSGEALVAGDTISSFSFRIKPYETTANLLRGCDAFFVNEINPTLPTSIPTFNAKSVINIPRAIRLSQTVTNQNVSVPFVEEGTNPISQLIAGAGASDVTSFLVLLKNPLLGGDLSIYRGNGSNPSDAPQLTIEFLGVR